MYKTGCFSGTSNVTNIKAPTAMGSGEAMVIKINNKENPAEEGDNDDDKDDERAQDNGGSGAEDGALVDLEQKVLEVESRWNPTKEEDIIAMRSRESTSCPLRQGAEGRG